MSQLRPVCRFPTRRELRLCGMPDRNRRAKLGRDDEPSQRGDAADACRSSRSSANPDAIAPEQPVNLADMGVIAGFDRAEDVHC